MEEITVLGFDFGRKYIGVATGQTITLTAQPLMTLAGPFQKALPHIQELIQAWKPTLLVVGLPLNMDGTESQLSKESTRFAAKLKNLSQLPVELIDERLSTRAARERLPPRHSKSQLNAVAAQIIIETYFSTLPLLKKQ